MQPVYHHPTRRRDAGFTILEMLVTAGLVSMLALITFPSLSTALNAHRLTAGLRETLGAIRVARSAAISHNVQSRLVVSEDGKTLSVEWNKPGVGWTPIGTPVVLESGVSVASVSPANSLVFIGRGSLSGNAAVTVTVQNARGDTRQIVVSILGGVDLV
jgi:prepilin-type N-terminal cleavage/methylation domain-containing protein